MGKRIAKNLKSQICFTHMETNKEICIESLLAGFYKKETLVLNEFNKRSYTFLSSHWKCLFITSF